MTTAVLRRCLATLTTAFCFEHRADIVYSECVGGRSGLCILRGVAMNAAEQAINDYLDDIDRQLNRAELDARW